MDPLPRQTLDRVLDLACRAPSVHNTQPWRWRVADRELRLHSDPSQRLMATDPSGRDLVVSCGAALHTAQVAAASEGWTAVVQRMPDPSDPTLLARLTFRPAASREPRKGLATLIQQRRTDRRQVSSWPVPQERLDRLRGIAQRLGVFLVTVERDEERALLDRLVARAATEQGRSGRYHDELLTWSQEQQGRGVPRTNQVARDRGAASTDPAARARFADGELSDPAVAPGAGNEPPTEAWAVLATSSDDTLSWLRTGEALQAMWLWCTAERMNLRPFSQPVEVDSVRRQLRTDLLGDTTCPQLVVRLGWAPLSNEPLPATPRQRLSEVLERLS